MQPHSFDFDDLSLEELRARQSVKWRRYPPDVLPAWVAETDFPLAPSVRAVLQEALARDDTGYASSRGLADAFAAFAAARFDWVIDPDRTLMVADVMSGVAEVLRALTAPGDLVVVNPPVYQPFFTVVRDLGREVVEAPLSPTFQLDLDALERAFAGRASVYLLCNPHNPTGTVFASGDLTRVAELAARYEVLVISDEVHAPMTLPGATHTPYLTVADEGLALVSASKAWNLAGLKCALVVAASEESADELGRVPGHVSYHAGHFGVLAAIAGFNDDESWLDALVAHLDLQRKRLAELLAAELPAVRCTLPEAGYLAWLDCRALGLGDDPSAVFLERGRVALSPGPSFGTEGNGFARLNFATSGDLLTEAVRRMARSLP
jgi:cysteine-S-conjugate beta-lyase